MSLLPKLLLNYKFASTEINLSPEQTPTKEQQASAVWHVAFAPLEAPSQAAWLMPWNKCSAEVASALLPQAAAGAPAMEQVKVLVMEVRDRFGVLFLDYKGTRWCILFGILRLSIWAARGTLLGLFIGKHWQLLPVCSLSSWSALAILGIGSFEVVCQQLIVSNPCLQAQPRRPMSPQPWPCSACCWPSRPASLCWCWPCAPISAPCSMQ